MVLGRRVGPDAGGNLIYHEYYPNLTTYANTDYWARIYYTGNDTWSIGRDDTWGAYHTSNPCCTKGLEVGEEVATDSATVQARAYDLQKKLGDGSWSYNWANALQATGGASVWWNTLYSDLGYSFCCVY